MAIFELSKDALTHVPETTFAAQQFQERGDLQRLLRDNISVLAGDLMVISEEFGDWQDSRRRIDLLCIDKKANLVVVELKRTEDGGYMELQAIRYAAMISTMTFEKLVEAYQTYLAARNRTEDGRAGILDFLDWDEPNESEFAQRVRIILASAEFSTELTTSVMWLNRTGLDVRCIRLKPYILDGRTLLDVQQLIPLPEAADFQVRLRAKEQKERQAKSEGADWTRFDISYSDNQERNLYKRVAIFRICKHLCDNGVGPEDINQLIAWRPTRVWRPIDGEVDAEQYIELSVAEAKEKGTTFDPGRWYCDNDEMVQANGKTYTFSKMWGGETWHRAMALLKETYPQYHLDYHASDQ